MIRINLLAKDEIPKTRTIKVPEVGAFVPVIAAAIVLLACLGTSIVQKRSLDRLQADVAEAREESQRLAPQIARIKQLEREREQLDQRLDAITDLDRERYFRVHLLSELARRFPENAWLTEYIEISPSRVEIKGISFSNFIVADFLRDLGDSEYYEVIDLVLTQRGHIKDVKVLEFTLTADVGQPLADMTVAAGI
jgi:type IV pilus assembly protein PilN